VGVYRILPPRCKSHHTMVESIIVRLCNK
jgi:hypothetical protein